MPAPFAKEIVFSPLCFLISFVEDWLTIGVCGYFRAVYSVPRIHSSVFVPKIYAVLIVYVVTFMFSTDLLGSVHFSSLFFSYSSDLMTSNVLIWYFSLIFFLISLIIPSCLFFCFWFFFILINLSPLDQKKYLVGEEKRICNS